MAALVVLALVVALVGYALLGTRSAGDTTQPAPESMPSAPGLNQQEWLRLWAETAGELEAPNRAERAKDNRGDERVEP